MTSWLWLSALKGVLAFTHLNLGAVNLIIGPPRQSAQIFLAAPLLVLPRSLAASPSVKPYPIPSLTRTLGQTQTWIGAALLTQNGYLGSLDGSPRVSDGGLEVITISIMGTNPTIMTSLSSIALHPRSSIAD